MTFLPTVATPIRFCPHTQETAALTTALNNRHSSSASSVHFGNSRDTLSTNDQLTS